MSEPKSILSNDYLKKNITYMKDTCEIMEDSFYQCMNNESFEQCGEYYKQFRECISHKKYPSISRS